MKWYWHLLLLFLSAVSAWFAGDWLNRPLWQIVEQHPVSFDQCKIDRKEWTTLVGDEERRNWWIETRAGRDPTVIRRLKLELPPLTGEIPYFGASISVLKMSCDAVLCHEYISAGDVEMHYCILDPVTGKFLRRFTIPHNPIGKIAGHGNKLAFVEKASVHFYDIDTKIERSVRVGNVNCLTFSPNGKLLACVDWTNNTFHFIDWDKADLIEPVGPPKTVVSFTFISNDTLLLVYNRGKYGSNQQVHSRWRWDGAGLKQITPGITLASHQILPFFKATNNSELHLNADALKDWPLQFKSLFQWLADKTFPVERWFPKKVYRHWVVLDNQDHIQREYYENNQSSRRRELYDHFSVEVEPDKQYATSTITFWNEHPVWPNALAVGLVLYLLLFVMMRVIRERL